MTAPRPTFRVMKNGYDRFAVDDAVEGYAAKVDQLEKQLDLYKQQLEESNRRLAELQARYESLNNSISAQKQAADNIARLSLREANEIISTAQNNADEIIHQSLILAHGILSDLSRLYGQADTVKAETKQQLEALVRELDEFRMPRMPELKWMEEAEKKMR